MPVHLYGHPAAMDRIEAIAARHGLAIIEDAAQAHSASFDGRSVGEFGLTACFSFYPTKNMTTGEGGLVVTASADIARTLRLLRNQGMEKRYANEIVGFNNRMTDIAAAIGRVQLTRLPAWTARRQRNAKTLDDTLQSVITPPVAAGAVHVYHQYTVRSRERDRLQKKLTEDGIGSGVYYPTPIHRLPSFQLQLNLPETERAANEVLSLPVHPALTPHDLEAVANAVNTA
jgi:dTDP-4-amino-4,6-dideoxygalactose transaminase